MPASKISLDNAKHDKLFYFVANVVVYRKDNKSCLILKRDEREKVHPGKYGVIGGKLEWSDLNITSPSRINGDVLDFEDVVEKLLIREAYEEAGIKIDEKLHYINSVAFIRPDETPVVLVKFAALYESGDIILEKGAFSDYAWVNKDSVTQYDCIEGVVQEVIETINHFDIL